MLPGPRTGGLRCGEYSRNVPIPKMGRIVALSMPGTSTASSKSASSYRRNPEHPPRKSMSGEVAISLRMHR
jgi:hypothetical protein